MKILFIGKFDSYPWGEIPTEFFVADSLQKKGCKVICLDVDKLINGKPIEQNIKNDVDIVLFASGILQLPLEHFKSILGKIKAVKVLYTNDWIFLNKEREQIYLERLSYFDLLITSDSVDYKEYGIKQVRIPMACLPSYKFEPAPSEKLVFIGAVHYSKERREFLDKIRGCFGKLDVYGYCGNKNPIYGQELEKTIQRYKIVLGHNHINNSESYWSSRNYIIPGYGGFLITPYVEGLEKEFEDKKHIVWYNSFEECVDLIRYYLEHDEEREKIRKQGYEYVQKVHIWDIRIKEFVKFFKEVNKNAGVVRG